MKLGSSAAIAALLLFVSACGGSSTPPPSHTVATPDSKKSAFLAAANQACQSVSGKSLAAPRTSESKAALHAYATGAVSETRRALTLLEEVAAGRHEQAFVRPLLADYAMLLGDYGSLESSGAAGLLAKIGAEQRQASRLAGTLGLSLCAPASL